MTLPAPLPPLVDSHCHLDFPDFAGELDAVVARARAAQVTRMVTICTRLRQAPAVRAIAEAHDGVFWAAGTHPMHAAEEPLATVEALVALAAHPKFVGDRRDRPRLPLHGRQRRHPAGEPAPARRGRAADRPAPRHPRPRRRRRHRPHPRRGARRRPLRLRHALLHLGPRRSPRRPSPSASTCRSPASRPSAPPPSSAPSSPPRRAIGCSSRPTAPTWRRSPTAAAATSPPSPPTPCARWRRISTWTPPTSPA